MHGYHLIHKQTCRSDCWTTSNANAYAIERILNAFDLNIHLFSTGNL